MANLSFIAGGRKHTLFRRRSSGNFYVQFTANGKAQWYGTRTTIEAVAKTRAKQRIEEALNGTPVSEISFDGLVDRFTASRVNKGRGTVANDRSFAAVLRATFQRPITTPARDIVAGDLLTWLQTESKKRGWRNRTYNHYRLWLWQIFALGQTDRLILPKENPFADKTIKRRRLEPVVRNIPTDEQFVQLIHKVRSIEGDEAADFLEFLGGAGVGQAEASALSWRDVSESKMRFVRRKTGIEFQVPIYAWLAPLLARRRGKENRSVTVFQVNDAGKALRRACDVLGFTRFTQRGLRAMLIKRLYDRGVPVKRIALWQGHRDGGKLIQEIYTEVFCETDSAAEKADLALVSGLTLPMELRVVESAA